MSLARLILEIQKATKEIHVLNQVVAASLSHSEPIEEG